VNVIEGGDLFVADSRLTRCKESTQCLSLLELRLIEQMPLSIIVGLVSTSGRPLSHFGDRFFRHQMETFPVIWTSNSAGFVSAN